MIDFRYHLVSIVAVFLALGLGILLGATALQPTALSALQQTSNQEHQQIESALATNRQQALQIERNDQFAESATGLLVGQLLAGERVVVVQAPGASSQVVSGVVQALTVAGAAISGQVQLQNKFFDVSPATQEQLGQLAQQFTPAGVTLQGTPLAQASQVIASAIVTRDGPGQPVAGQRDSAGAALLSGFAAGSFLTISGHPDARATLAVVVIPENPPPPNGPDTASQGLVAFAQQLDRASQGTVVAGSVPGSGPGSAIDVMRSGEAGHMSSVDDADHMIGQIVVVQALYEQLRGGSGNYGSTSSATMAGPSPAPTPPVAPTGAAGAQTTGQRTPRGTQAGKS